MSNSIKFSTIQEYLSFYKEAATKQLAYFVAIRVPHGGDEPEIIKGAIENSQMMMNLYFIAVKDRGLGHIVDGPHSSLELAKALEEAQEYYNSLFDWLSIYKVDDYLKIAQALNL